MESYKQTFEHLNMYELVSIVMLSRNGKKYVEESVRSILAQTYSNWELLFVEDSNDQDVIQRMMELGRKDQRIHVFQMVNSQGETINRNSVMKDVRGKWISFLDVGDVWLPEKLEHQVRFMEESGYAFSYTQYGLMDDKSKGRDVIIGGKEHINHKSMLKCCWPALLTVMYDVEKVGLMRIKKRQEHNDYALLLEVSKKTDCHLLKENLATMRTPWGILGGFVMTNKFKWRYDCYLYQEELNSITSYLYTLRNLFFGMWKWMWYVKRL